MAVTTPYVFIGFGAMAVTKPYKSIVFGAMYVTKPYKFMAFGAMGERAIGKRARFLPQRASQRAHAGGAYRNGGLGGIYERGCALAWHFVFSFFSDRKSAIFGVWAAPGAPETLAKGGGLRPPPV